MHSELEPIKLECRQLRDAGGHPEYIICFHFKPQIAIVEYLGEKRKS